MIFTTVLPGLNPLSPTRCPQLIFYRRQPPEAGPSGCLPSHSGCLASRESGAPLNLILLRLGPSSSPNKPKPQFLSSTHLQFSSSAFGNPDHIRLAMNFQSLQPTAPANTKTGPIIVANQQPRKPKILSSIHCQFFFFGFWESRPHETGDEFPDSVHSQECSH